MSQILINIGTVPNDGTGDSIRAAFANVNTNFTDLYDKIGGNLANATTVPTLVVTSNLYASGSTQVRSSGFTIVDSTLTRTAQFDLSAISSGTTKQYALPNGNTTLVGHDFSQTLTNKFISGDSNTFTNIPLTSAVTGVLPLTNGGTGNLLTIPYGGTGLSSAPNNGQLLIGNGSGYVLSTLTAGTGIAITNLAGQIIIENTGGGGSGGNVTNAITDGTTSFVVSNTSASITASIRGSQVMVANSNVAIYSTSVQLAPGSTSRAPLIFPAGSLLTTPQNGAVEYDSTKFYITIGGVRRQVATYDQITAGAVTSWNGMTGNITMSGANVVTALGYTPLSSNTGGTIGGNIRVTGDITTQSTGGTGGFGNILTGNITASNSITATTVTGTLQTAAQPNITSVGTLTSLSVTGNSNVGNINATTIKGTLTTASQPNITTVGYLNGLNMAANIAMNNNFITGLANGTATTDAVNKGYVDALVASVPRDIIVNGTTHVDANYSDINLAILGTQVASVTSAGATVTGNISATKNITATANLSAENVLTTGTTINSGVTTSGNLTATNVIANTGIYGTILTANQTTITTVGTLTGLTVSGAVVPNANATVNLGSAAAWWNTVYGVSFQGVSTTAKYADLAEKYATDKTYEIGTVITIGGAAEATACALGDRAIGVISEFPAYLMNSESTGQAVALKGRVPVKVSGPVRKGQRLIAGPDGTAIASSAHIDTFAIALEESSDDGIKLVEAIIL